MQMKGRLQKRAEARTGQATLRPSLPFARGAKFSKKNSTPCLLDEACAVLRSR